MRNYLWIAIALLLASCSTPSSVAPVSFPLDYKTKASPGEFPALASCAAVSDVRVTDARTDKTIGKRFVEGKTAAAADVATTSDVAAWVRAGAMHALKRAGVATGKSGAPTLRLSIDQISTSENVLHRSGYEGSAENYQETLNHALDRAMIRMLNASQFKSAICSCGG